MLMSAAVTINASWREDYANSFCQTDMHMRESCKFCLKRLLFRSDVTIAMFDLFANFQRCPIKRIHCFVPVNRVHSS
jgi:hypothetical protein